MELHGLSYDGMASVRVNRGPWLPLTNQTVTVAEPGRSYGGIGGGFATLKITVPLQEHPAVDGENTLEVRFNQSNGIASGLRVLSFNFLDALGEPIVPRDSFADEDPNMWRAPFGGETDVAAGRNLWHSAQLAANGLPNSAHIRAHCSDCHAKDGRDLKYFNYSNLSIAARARFHGLSEKQGLQIASYIRSLKAPNPGRPWNPPYQPGPSLAGRPISEWAAGAGLSSVLNDDSGMLPFLTPASIRPDANLDPRVVPLAIQLPDWNHWLPRVHPLDFRNEAFRNSELFRLYDNTAAASSPGFFDKWLQARIRFLPAHPKWTPALAEDHYSVQLWQLVKTWELMQTRNLEESGTWGNSMPGATAPAETNIPDGPVGVGRSALTNEYFNNAWYEVQEIVNNGNHRHHGRGPVDWLYLLVRYKELQRYSNVPEPGRILVALVKSMQSSDPEAGPDNYSEGWRPDRIADPRILISEDWRPVFQSLSPAQKLALMEAVLSAWLDKTAQFPLASYFSRGYLDSDYKVPPPLQTFAGGRVWEAAPKFQSAGVSQTLIDRLQAWGEAYSKLAELYRY
jgi:hypothetical protein